MKKLLLLWIAAAVLLTPMTQISAFNDTKGTQAERPAEVLGALGILQGYADGNVKPDEAITRAEFVVMMDRLLNAQSMTFDAAQFADVPTNHWARREISTAVALGLIDGRGNAVFDPDATIELREAAKILVRVLGYSEKAEQEGGYPLGYIQTAASLRLFSNISDTGQPLTRGSAAILIYNALDVRLMKMADFGRDRYEIQDINILEERHEIYRSRGRVTMNYYTGLYGESNIRSDEIRIEDSKYGDKVYKLGKSGIDFANALGLNGDYYFRYNEAEDVYILIYFAPLSSMQELYIADEDLIEYKSGVLYYNNDGRRHSAAIPADAAIIYNFQAIRSSAEFDEDMFCPDNGGVTLIENNGVYDVVKIEDYVDYVVGSVNVDKYTIYDKLFPNKSLVLDKTDRSKMVVLEDLAGSDIEISDITAMDIVTAAQSKSKNFVKAVVSGSGIRGTVTEVNEDYIKVENEKHRLGSNFKEYLEQNFIELGLGKQYVFYLNARSDISAMDVAPPSDIKQAYIVNIAARGLSGYQIKLFNEDGNMIVLDIADRVIVNGKSNMPAEDFARINPIGLVVMYKLDSDGKFKTVHLGIPNDIGESGDFLIIHDDGDVVYRYKDNVLSFGGKFYITTDTKVFVVPLPGNISAADDLKDYRVEKNEYFKGDDDYAVIGYSTIKDSLVADTVVCYTVPGNEKMDKNASLYVVERLTTAINEEGSVFSRIYLNNNGTSTPFEADKERIKENGMNIDELVPGDVIKISRRNDVVVQIEKYFDVTTKTNTAGEASYNGQDHTLSGLVRKKDRHLFSIYNPVSEQDEVNVMNRGTILICDKTPKGEIVVTAGSAADILDYETSNQDASFVFLQSRYAEPRIIIIYKF